MSRSNWHARAALVAVLVLGVAGLGAGCGVSDDAGESKEASADVVDGQTIDDGSGSSTSSTTPADEASGSGSVDVSGVDLPRTLTYAGFEITVDEAVAATDALEGPGVALSLTVRNLLGEIGRLRPESIGLVDADGTRIQAVGFEDPDDSSVGYSATYDLEVTPNGKTRRRAFLPVEGALDLATVKFSVAEKEKLPEEVPLTGEVPESGLPLPVTVPTEPVELNDALKVTLKSAELTEEYGRLRAPEGGHLVVVKMRFEAINGHNTTADSNTVRLVVDGTPLGAVLQDPPGAGGVVTGGADDVTEVYELPDDYTEVSMLGIAGNGGPPDHPFAITVPPLPGS